MTDTEKLKLIDRMIQDFSEHGDYGEKICLATLLDCISSVINFREEKK